MQMKRVGRLVGALGLIGVLAGCANYATQEQVDAEMAELREMIATQQAKLEQKHEGVDQLRADVTTQQDNLARVEAGFDSQIRRYDRQLQDLEQQVETSGLQALELLSDAIRDYLESKNP